MPRISDLYTQCAVYIYGSLADAKNGEKYGGSGFLCHVPLTENPPWSSLYVVTNWHVIEKAQTPVVRLNRKDGTAECVPTRLRDWFRHLDGDDVAAFPLVARYDDLKIWSLNIGEFVTPQRVLDEDIGVGDDTIMIGRFVNHEGKQRNSPAVRFGNIAMMTEERIVTESGVAQEAFLVEVRSLPGYSGSAVLVYSPCAMNDMSLRRKGQKRVGPSEGGSFEMPPQVFFDAMTPKGPFLLGIDFCHIHRNSSVLGPDGKPVEDKLYVKENTGMAGVIPAWKIAEVLDRPELQDMRNKADREMTEETSKSRDGGP